MEQNTVNDKISMLRYEYLSEELARKDLDISPFKQFDKWMHNALKAEIAEANAMCLSTITKDGYPTSRIVLLREYDEDGFIFYTNYLSDKAKELDKTPKAEVNFFWPQLQRQMRIRGNIEKVSKEKSDKYYASRPRLSQISAWASKQSSQIDSRKNLEQNMQQYMKEFEGKDIPRPEDWGGFRLKPFRMEFWQGRLSRLHDRFVYTLNEAQKWEISRLSP